MCRMDQKECFQKTRLLGSLCTGGVRGSRPGGRNVGCGVGQAELES